MMPAPHHACVLPAKPEDGRVSWRCPACKVWYVWNATVKHWYERSEAK